MEVMREVDTRLATGSHQFADFGGDERAVPLSPVLRAAQSRQDIAELLIPQDHPSGVAEIANPVVVDLLRRPHGSRF
jgi:hypothetical protein